MSDDALEMEETNRMFAADFFEGIDVTAISDKMSCEAIRETFSHKNKFMNYYVRDVLAQLENDLDVERAHLNGLVALMGNFLTHSITENLTGVIIGPDPRLLPVFSYRNAGKKVFCYTPDTVVDFDSLDFNSVGYAIMYGSEPVNEFSSVMGILRNYNVDLLCIMPSQPGLENDFFEYTIQREFSFVRLYSGFFRRGSLK